MKDTLMINLLDINEHGKEFDFKKGTDRALDAQLFDTIESLEDFNVHLKLRNAGEIYMAEGKFNIKKDDQCSLCAEDIVQDFNFNFTEYLVLDDKKDQDGHAPHSGLNYETTQETYFIDSLEFDVFSFLREIITANIPLYPKCEDTKKCENTRAQLQARLDDKTKKGMSPFSVLEQLKKKQ